MNQLISIIHNFLFLSILFSKKFYKIIAFWFIKWYNKARKGVHSMSIGSRIKEKRIERGWSQRELAAKMNYSNHSTIGKIESGKVDLPQSRIAQFAEVLRTDVAFLMGWDEEMNGQAVGSELSARKKAFMQKVEGMSDAQIERLEQILALVENTEL